MIYSWLRTQTSQQPLHWKSTLFADFYHILANDLTKGTQEVIDIQLMLPLLPPGVWSIMQGSLFRSEISLRKGLATDLIPARLSTQGEVLRISVGTSVTGISFKLLPTPPLIIPPFFFKESEALSLTIYRKHKEIPQNKQITCQCGDVMTVCLRNNQKL